ncbi:probable RNA-binding protein 18 [Uloborus diversus]|uniref:probable RNA-binding protein 18 n=1 Tax=Uloborus diversus TaxID=327109 RepID=UPI00240959DF|nr:probable RNA-binding protein 18 [Uloborus diversus]
MSIEPSVPLPLDPPPPPEADEKRLWIGNIDSRLTEYNLLKMVQQFGEIKKFDFLFHKSGPLKGMPRGYCFVTYETREQAEKALAALHGKRVLDKDLAVKWSHSVSDDVSTREKVERKIVGMTADEAKLTKDTLHQIMAIEEKLKAMAEQRDKELELCLTSFPTSASNPLVLSTKNSSVFCHKTRNGPYNRDRKHSRPHKR